MSFYLMFSPLFSVYCNILLCVVDTCVTHLSRVLTDVIFVRKKLEGSYQSTTLPFRIQNRAKIGIVQKGYKYFCRSFYILI